MFSGYEKTVSAKVPAGVWAKFAQIAATEQRTVSGEMRHLIERRLAEVQAQTTQVQPNPTNPDN